jgi:quercetin dioxygenase-like cupin family protein
MRITSPGFISFAIIDPAKKVKEEGQYKKFFVSETDDFRAIIDDARKKNLEIRYHYTDIENNEGGTVPVRLILTEIPPGHIQPFHVHKNCYEITVVEHGEVSYIEDDSLGNEDRQEIKNNSKVLRTGDMVFDDNGKRHTVANFSDAYAKVLTTQTPKPYAQAFAPDWSGE